MKVFSEECPKGATRAYGGVVLSSEGLVLLREPANHFDGYVWTVPKGKPDPGESPEQTALREVREETGVEARITGELPGWYLTGSSATKIFMMALVEDHGEVDAETTAIKWLDWEAAAEHVGKTRKPSGRARDQAILAAARSAATRAE